MIEAGIVLATAAVAWVLLTAPVRTNYVVIVLVLALVPPLASVPNGVTPQMFITRVLVIASGLGLAIRIHRGEAPGARFGRHPVFVVVLLALVVSLVNGVVLVNDMTNIGSGFQRWLSLVDQALVLLVVVALLRAVDDLVWAVKVIVVAFSVAAFIGLVEVVTKVRVMSIIFGAVTPLLDRGLTVRGGFVRPRGTFEFAQEFGLVLAFIAPLALVWAALRRRPWMALGATALIVLVSLLTISRSAVISLVVASLVLLVVSRTPSIRTWVLLGVAVGALAAVAFPSWWGAFSGADVTGSTQARIDRPPVVTQLVASHPWNGLGFTGIEDQVPATDNQYLLTYAEVGVIGGAALAAMWLGIVVALAWGLRSPPSRERTVLAGCVAAVIAGLVAAGTIDLFTLGGSRVFWLIGAVGLVASERIASPLPLEGRRRLVAPGLVAAGAGLAIGVIAIAIYPRTSAREFVFTTWPTTAEATDQGSGFHIGEVYVNSVCEHSAVLDDTSSTAQFDCREVRGSSGAGLVRISARNDRDLEQAARDELSIGNVLSGFQLLSSGPVIDALPTPVRTAPIWLAALFAFVVWAPRLRPRTRAPR